MEEILAGGCFNIYLVGDFSFDRLPEEEQIVVIPFVMRALRMAGLRECSFGTLYPDEEVTEVWLRYTGFMEGDLVESCLSYTTRYFSLYERPGILVQNPFRRAKHIAELADENFLGFMSRSLFIGGDVTYPPRDKDLMSPQMPTGDWETDRHKPALVKCTNNLAIQKFRFLASLDLPRGVRLCERNSAAGGCLKLPGLEGSEEGEEERRDLDEQGAAKVYVEEYGCGVRAAARGG